MNKTGLFLLLILSGSFIFPSCIKEEIQLTRYHRKLVDSLTQLQTAVIRDDMDSLCAIRMLEEMDQHTDSIVQIRLIEIRNKIETETNAKKN